MKHMRSASLALLILVITAAGNVMAQPAQRGAGMGQRGGVLTGRVIDGDLDQPIQYATIILFANQDSSKVTGATTGEDGQFLLTNVPPGQYYAKVSFLGYESVYQPDIQVQRGGGRVPMGEIALHQASLDLDEVNYVIERSPVEFHIDKKVVHVDKQATSASGTAVDILENVPSVSVDIEGNVSLRGSGNFTVLIDGRPTVLDANDALQQVPAGSIENIEIITNPSAKYDPEGTAGILNIVLKKDRREGTSGMVNVDGGIPGRYGVDGLVQQKYDGLTFTLGADYNVRGMPGSRDTYTRSTLGGVTTITEADGDMERHHDSWGVRGSVDWDANKKDWFSLGARLGGHSGGHESDTRYVETVDTLPDPNRYTSLSERSRGEVYGTTFLEYRHTYSGPGHELVARIQGSWEDDEEETSDELINENDTKFSGRKSYERGPSSEYEARLDYTWPFSEDGKFESGYDFQMDLSNEETGLSEYDGISGGYIEQSNFDRSTNYNRSIHAVYAIYGNKWGALGAQGGLRGEYTDRMIELEKSGQEFTIDRFDLFPSIHLSYDMGNEFQTMGSYSRRIDRPRGWFLEPFETWMDAYNVRKGNPGIEPEYIDSYEIGYQTPLGPFHHSTEVYYRVTNNLVEYRHSIYSPGVTLRMPENVGTGKALGTEVMFTGDVMPRVNVNLMGNFYNNQIDVDNGRDTEDFSWSTRLAVTWKVNKRYRIQANGMYNSPVVSSQGEREEFYMINGAVQGSFFNEALTAILQVRDIFDTANYTRITDGPNLYSRMAFDRQGPFVGLTLRYNFNHYREKRNGRNGGGSEIDQGDFME